LLLSENGSLVDGLEPFDGVFSVDSLVGSDVGFASSSVGDAVSGTIQHHIKVHSVDADLRIVFQAQIDVLLDTEAEVA